MRSTAATMILTGLMLGLPACAPVVVNGDFPGETTGTSSGALSSVPGSVTVGGKSYDVEGEYLPRVVQCENPNGPIESLRVQAIAARTYLAYKTKGQSAPTIGDGQSDQVFTCSSNQNGAYVASDVVQAVNDTKGQIVLHDGNVICGFFVAGALRDSDCSEGSDSTNTERFVTINDGNSGSSVIPTSLGSKTSPDNRGAMGQNLSNCLAETKGLTAPQILAYFYGSDITIKNSTASTTLPVMLPDDPVVDPGNTQTMQDPDAPDPSVGVCFSYTTQTQLPLGACVQSSVDGIWYQCTDTGDFATGVVNDSGPVGQCTVDYQN